MKPQRIADLKVNLNKPSTWAAFEDILCSSARLDVFYMFVTVCNFVLVSVSTLIPTPRPKKK